MRISLLLQREPLSTILEETLTGYWERLHGQSFDVRWQAGRPREKEAGELADQIWLVNAYLNAIFLQRADAAIFDPIRREYARSPVWWRRPAQQAYTSLSLWPPTAPALAQARLAVTPAVPRARDLLIIPGNHKVRLLDRREGITHCLLKAGYGDTFMQRELAGRRLATRFGLPVPALQEVAGDGRWFREAYISGTPINRLADPLMARQAVERAQSALSALHAATAATATVTDYTQGLCEQIESLLAGNQLLNASTLERVRAASRQLAEQAAAGQDARNEELATAFGHGDFQPANVLRSEQGVWLIDWECAGRRQLAYDSLVYSLAARSPARLAQRLQQFVRAGWLTGAPAIEMAPERQLPWMADEAGRRRHAAMFLLEELVWRLEENAEPAFTRLDPGFSPWLEEAGLWVEMNRER
jgi:hypothetical protein